LAAHMQREASARSPPGDQLSVGTLTNNLKNK